MKLELNVFKKKSKLDPAFFLILLSTMGDAHALSGNFRCLRAQERSDNSQNNKKERESERALLLCLIFFIQGDMNVCRTAQF